MHAEVFRGNRTAADGSPVDNENWFAHFKSRGRITFADPQPRDSKRDAIRAVEAHVRGVITKRRLFDLLHFTRTDVRGVTRITWR